MAMPERWCALFLKRCYDRLENHQINTRETRSNVSLHATPQAAGSEWSLVTLMHVRGMVPRISPQILREAFRIG